MKTTFKKFLMESAGDVFLVQIETFDSARVRILGYVTSIEAGKTFFTKQISQMQQKGTAHKETKWTKSTEGDVIFVTPSEILRLRKLKHL